MTTAVLNIIIFFVGLLFLYVLWIVIFFYKTKSKTTADIDEDSYLIVYASQSGQTEAYAKETAKQLISAGEPVKIVEANQLSTSLLMKAKKVIWMLSTYGEGDAPDNAQHLNQWFFNQNLDLSHQSFAILAFGDRRYQHFCGFAENVNAQLLKNLAKPWFNMVTVDQHASQDLLLWRDHLENVTSHQLKIREPAKDWQLLTLKGQYLLNEGSQGNPLYHIVLKAPYSLIWKSGDILEIQCSNVATELSAFKKRFPDLLEDDLNDLIFKDLINSPSRSDSQSKVQWISQFKDLPLREYSIANIPGSGYLNLVVRQELNQGVLGLGSGLLTKKMEVGQNLVANIRQNPLFHLIDKHHPAIFIGNGSGIAGLMAHLYQREKNKQGQNWLIFGERQSAVDDIFDEQLIEWQKKDHLKHLDRVYSRDGGDIKYVQDVIYQKQNQLRDWISRGGIIYVCGSLNGMATDVNDALLDILGEMQFDELKRQNRYLRDVY